MGSHFRLGRSAASAAGVIASCLALAAAEPDRELAKKMLPIYVKEAESYSLTVESDPTRALELKKEPVFEWANPARNDQQGVIFLWLREGRPAALACTFSYPHKTMPGRVVTHELHALDPERLLVKRDSLNQWKPEMGLTRQALADAPEPATTAAARMVQMRRLAQEFSGHEIDNQGMRWELRLLSTPLYRYPAARSGVIDGGLFALVSNAGTDPEVLVLIEAREVEGKIRWEYACGRFSDLKLHVLRKDREVFTSVPGEDNRFGYGPGQLYRIYPEKVVTLEGKLLARLQQNPSLTTGKNPGVRIIPVEDE